jgi:hypothetical protein
MVLSRLQVRMTFLSPRIFIVSIFFKSLGSMKGPFFKDRDIVSSLACAIQSGKNANIAY